MTVGFLSVVVIFALGAVSVCKEENYEQEPIFHENGEELWYVPGTYNRDTASEILYLKGQCDVMWPREKEIFDEFLPAAAVATQSKKPYIIADIGCGPGYTSAEILKQYPNTATICIDVQKDFVEQAEKVFDSIPEAHGRYAVKTGTVLQSTLESNSVDAVLTRLVLQHIPKIQDAIAETFRVLKPGGTLFVIDTDESMGDVIVPRVDAIDELAEIHANMRSQRSHEAISLHMWGWLEDAGFEVQRFDSASVHSAAVDQPEAVAAINNPSVYYTLSQKGLVKTKKVDQAVQKWKTATKKDPIQMVVHFFYYIARKPLAGAKEEL